FNLGLQAINLQSTIRWDTEKRRVMASVSAPLRNNPKYRYEIGADLRNENWNLGFASPGTGGSRLNLRREALQAEITSFTGGRWNWSAGGEFSHRDYRNVLFG